MFEKLWAYLQYGTRFCGIEHSNGAHGVGVLAVSVLRRKKNEINIDACFEAESIEGASAKLNKNQHAVLVINNDHVLSKYIEAEQNDALKLVYKAFPNIGLEDFYFEVLSQHNHHWVSLCRKDYVDSLIEDYAKHNVSIIGLSFSNNAVAAIKDFVQTGNISSSNARILVEDKQIHQIEKGGDVPTETYNFRGLTVSNRFLLSFAGALNSILNTDTTQTNFEIRKKFLLGEYKQARFFGLFLKIGGVFILSLLLINFLLFNHYFNEANELRVITEVNQSTKQRIVQLNELVAKKQKMVDDLLKSKTSNSSFFINALVLSLPQTILLSEINYQPLKRRIKSEKPVDLDKNTIVVSGTSNDSKKFSAWVSQIEQQDWAIKVDIVDYGSASNRISNFKIKIMIQHDETN